VYTKRTHGYTAIMARIEEFKSVYGTVKPYTRHVSGCKVKNDSCNCPKWLYEHRKGCERRRYSLGTPSMKEARDKASEILRGFDPEIAAARAVTAKRDAALMTVRDAAALWIQRTATECGSDAGHLPQYRSLMKMFEKWAVREHIDYVQDITPLQLQQWYGSRDWARLAITTRKQRWGVMRSVFRFLHVRGVLESNPAITIDAVRAKVDHRQGPYTQKQVAAIFASIDKTVPENIELQERASYALRLHAFITLLLNVGCDVVDGVLFQQSKLTDEEHDGHSVTVYRYSRQKTGVKAVIPVSAEVAAALRSVPMLRNNPQGMPFRYQSIAVASDVHNWSRRIKRVLDAAGVKFVELPPNEHGKVIRKGANAKQFRHTFAVRQLECRQRPEVVARQLGHTDTEMIREHYAPWCDSLDAAHVREVIGL
jgi:integrase